MLNYGFDLVEQAQPIAQRYLLVFEKKKQKKQKKHSSQH
jgi:hypothetical protein